MIDDKQSSIIRPKPVPPMFTPVLTQNSQPANAMNSMGTRINQQAFIDLITALRKHDPEATHLHDCIAQVKIFVYNSIDLRWENTANIEGNLCAYEKKQVINNTIHPPFAFAVLNGDKSLIQPVTLDMVHHVDKVRLFYEVARNGQREVFCAHFLTEAECLRLHTFLFRCIQTIQKLAEQQAQAPPPLVQPAPPAVDIQAWMHTQLNGQNPSPVSMQQAPHNVYRQKQQQQQQTMTLPNSNLSTTLQFGSARMVMNPTPTRLATLNAVQNPTPIQSYPIQTPIDINNTNMPPPIHAVPVSFAPQVDVGKTIEPVLFPNSPISLTNGNNNNVEDPTSSLKRLLNIRSQTGLEHISLEDSPSLPKGTSQTNTMDLMPPSAFEPIGATPPSPVVAIGAERLKHRTSNPVGPAISRDHFRNVLLHLIQNDDRFLDIIYQACLTYSNSSQ